MTMKNLSQQQLLEALWSAPESDAILVYRFDDAPLALQALSNNGGDEDWLALIPKHMVDTGSCWISWMESSSFDSMGEPQEFTLPDGRMVKIGSHA